jgi:hypothetical protein
MYHLHDDWRKMLRPAEACVGMPVSSTNNSPDSLVRYAIITRYLSQCFVFLLNTAQVSRPLSNRYFPVWVIWSLAAACYRLSLMKWMIGRMLVNEDSIAIGEKFLKRDQSKGRPMVRIPSVPSPTNTVIYSY